MRILRHRLHAADGQPIEFRASPNHGRKMTPEFLVMHYTAGAGFDSSADWMTRPEARASAHLLIGREGRILQLVPFDTVAWHAGASSWEGRQGLNHFSIGIELDNAGRLTRQGDHWRAWFGGQFRDDDVLVATHRHEAQPSGWHTFPPVQLEAALECATLLVRKYGLLDVLGHDDISPGRKADPGPAFPMVSFRSRIFGREGDEPPRFETTAALNIRSGPGTQHDTVPGSPLPIGTRLQVLAEQDSWRLVDVLDVVQDLNDIQGWVHQRFIRRVRS
jgi:N-acetylmuramoyl-L-alanine amidase